ncbi:MAG: hypothetical protein PHG65_11300, partial [Kiritimatiellae bacterium]|nr:hypothetical protein [Kiritimatiellia bacterium]
MRFPCRSKLLPAVLPILSAVLFTACGAEQSARPGATQSLQPALFESERALREAADLAALYPRDAGTPGAEHAALHLRDRLQ